MKIELKDLQIEDEVLVAYASSGLAKMKILRVPQKRNSGFYKAIKVERKTCIDWEKDWGNVKTMYYDFNNIDIFLINRK